MAVLQHLEPKDVFKYFEEISAVPRGSGNRDKIAQYCMNFASEHGLKAVCDNAKNVVIYKEAAKGYENASPVILQGHLDMVCQKVQGCAHDFEKDGIALKVDGDVISAYGTTLGADNGIAVAMVLAILASDNIPHPPIEAVFTADEEIGMLGALELDASLLSGKRMINLDSEEEDVMTVSCAGGSDFSSKLCVQRKSVCKTLVNVTLKGLRGGHSGICINEKRVNANILAGRFLKTLESCAEFYIVSINGGDKANAIPLLCEISMCVSDAQGFKNKAEDILCALANEISSREPDFAFDISVGEKGEYNVFDDESKKALVYSLVCTPNGVQDMSADIDGLVETSLNLGVLQTEPDSVNLRYALRSNKKTALRFLEHRMAEFYSVLPAKTSVSGQYPPWEFKKDSIMQKVYCDAYRNTFNKEVKVEAIHAGLECGVFCDMIDGLDCIAIGPDAVDVHTVNEHLSASSVERIYTLVKAVLAQCK